MTSHYLEFHCPECTNQRNHTRCSCSRCDVQIDEQPIIDRIIKLLEDESRQCEKAGLWANGSELRGQLQELHLGLNAAIALIKGENK